MAYQQSFLPIIASETKRILGLYAIASTTFTGAETTFSLGLGPVPVGLWTPQPSKIRRSSGPFMAALPTHADVFSKAWQGFRELVPIRDVMPHSEWVVSPNIQGLREYEGPILRGLRYPGAFDVNPTPTVISPPTVTTPATLTWNAAARFLNAPQYKFFEFNWVTSFAASFPTTEAAFIVPTTQPAGGALMSTIVANAQPILNEITYNTVRIINTSATPLAAGAYAFGFNIFDRHQNVTAVVLNLTVN